jgi:outer membrane protein assembly factor BamE
MRVIVFLMVILVSACSSFGFPGVHKVTIQQGNVITQAMVDQLRPGMTKNQVRFILGNAIVDDSLDMNRWDYIYTLQIAGQKPAPRYMSLFFADEKLVRFEGDYVPSSQQANASNN